MSVWINPPKPVRHGPGWRCETVRLVNGRKMRLRGTVEATQELARMAFENGVSRRPVVKKVYYTWCHGADGIVTSHGGVPVKGRPMGTCKDCGRSDVEFGCHSYWCKACVAKHQRIYAQDQRQRIREMRLVRRARYRHEATDAYLRWRNVTSGVKRLHEPLIPLIRDLLFLKRELKK